MIQKFRNSILLSAIGDSLGWITEFEKSPHDLKKKYGVSHIEDFVEWEKFVGGRFNGYLDKINKGSYSDDTQLLLAVARSIKANGSIDNRYFSKIELPTWLSYARGAGRTIKNAAKKIGRKSAAWNNNFFKFKAGKTTIDYRESGANGAAMRILPIVLANHNDFDLIKEYIFSNSIITHGHPRAIVGAILYGFAIDKMLNQNVEEFSYETYLTELGKQIKLEFNPDFVDNEKYEVWLNTWNNDSNQDFLSLYEETVQESLNALRNIYKFIRDEKDTKDSLIEFGCYNPVTKGSGISTVIGGIYLAVKYYKDPSEAILKAVNSIGTDSDSIAAFTGGLIGSLYESEIIPPKWKEVQDSDYLYNVAENLYNIWDQGILTNPSPDIEALSNSLNQIKSDQYQEKEKINFDPLGKGVITNIDRQKTLTKGKYNLIIDVHFENGQSCKFSKLLDIKENSHIENYSWS